MIDTNSLRTAWPAIAMILALTGTNPIVCLAKQDNDAKRTEKIKAALASLGVSKTNLVKLKLRDKREVVGYIESIDANSVTITDAAGRWSETIAYSDTVSVKAQPFAAMTARPHGLSRGARLAIIGAVLAGLIVVVAIFAPKT